MTQQAPATEETSPVLDWHTPVLGYDPGDFRAAIAYAVNRGLFITDEEADFSLYKLSIRD